MCVIMCDDPSFGLATKAKAWKGVVNSTTWESHLHSWEFEGVCEGMNPHIPKWTPTLGDPMESQIFKKRFQRSNSLD
jgi:hypothetical protein